MSDLVASFMFANFSEEQSTKNNVACVHTAIPCSSFTFSAGRHDRVLRSDGQPCGFDGLSHDQQLKVADSNRIAKAL